MAIMLRSMRIKLYVVHGSHPCATVEEALRIKRLDYKRVELLPPLHAPLQRLRFGVRTVPGITIDGEKLAGSIAILRRLEQLAPDPSLFPADPVERAMVEEAERWGEATFQPIARRVLWPSLKRCPKAIASFTEGARVRLPAAVLRLSVPLIAPIETAMNKATDDALRADLRALPSQLDKIDAWIAEGVLGGEQPNAADLQIASTIRLLYNVGDLRPLIEGRPAGELARRLFPSYPGDVPAGTLPAEWLPEAA